MSSGHTAFEHFPSTHRTWLETRIMAIDAAIHDGAAPDPVALGEVRQHLMARYYEPLIAYARGSSLRGVDAPEELIHGFFAHTVANPRFLSAWTQRGGTLRRWMMNGLILHVRGIVRDRARTRERGALDDCADEPAAFSREPTAERAFEAAWALAMLDEALRDAQQSLEGQGRAESFEVFRRHVIDRRTYPELARELGIDPVRAATEVRAVMQSVRASLTERLRGECERGADLEAEVRAVLGLIGAV